MRIVQSPGFVAISYELIHDTRMIPLDAVATRDGRRALRTYMGIARGRWEGTTLVVETTNLQGEHARVVARPPADRAVHANRTDAIDYQVTFIDPATWTAPWTAALDMKARPDDAGVFEYACHEGNYGL